MSIKCLVWPGRLLERQNNKVFLSIAYKQRHVTCPKPKRSENPPECLLSVVSRHGQVEARLADVSLHPMNRLAGSGAEQTGIKQLDDI